MRSSIRPPQVPTGWRPVELGQIARIHGGGRLGLTKSDYVTVGARAYSAAGQDGRVLLEESAQPAVILSSIGARCGKCFLALEPWTTLANTQAIIPDPSVCDATYLHAYVNSEAYWFRSGSAQPFIAPSTVKQAWIALPPLPEQRRIAAILSSVDETIEKTEAVIAQLQVVKKAMMEELLTRGMPGRHTRFKQTEIGEVPEGWTVVELGSILASGPTNGIYKPAHLIGRGALLLGMTAIDRDDIDWSLARRAEVEPNEVDRFGLRGDDVLVRRVYARIDGVGRAVLVPSPPEASVYESNMMRLRFRPDQAIPGYAVRWFSLRRVRAQVEGGAQLAAQASINNETLRRLLVPLPPVAEQAEIRAALASIDERLRSESACGARLLAAKRDLASALLSGDLRVTGEEASR